MSDEAGDKVTEPSSSGGDGGAEDANKSEGSPAAEPEASEKSSEDDQSDEEQDEDYGPFGDHGGIWASDTDVGHIWVTSKGKKLKFTVCFSPPCWLFTNHTLDHSQGTHACNPRYQRRALF